MSKSKIITKSSIQRLIRDVKQIMKCPLHDNGIYYQHDQEDMLTGYAMIIGTKDTPYYGGFYFFKFSFPTNYPHNPPSVTYMTNGDHIRFNPNLYKTGKVCLSVLNTWRGDQWTSCQTISTILLSMCTVLSKDPLLNEPGITSKHADFSRYNTIIEFKNIDIAMLHMLTKNKSYYPSEFDRFYPNMKSYVIENKEEIRNYISDVVKNKKHKYTEVKTSLYSMNVCLDYNKLLPRFDETISTIQCDNIAENK